MEVNEELVQRVASLARLELSEEQVRELVPQFEEILSLFSDLQEVDTQGVYPSFHPIDKRDHLRDDVAERRRSAEEMLSPAKHTKDGYIKSPRAIK